MKWLSGFLVLVGGVAFVSCSELENVRIAAAEVSLVSCNNQGAPGSLALYVDFLFENLSDEEVQVTAVELETEPDEVDVVSGRQTLASSVSVEAGGSKAFSCKDGFSVRYPGENTLTDVRLEVTYRVGASEITTVSYVKMGTTVAWDNCGAFLGNARACAPK
jgi:hypothetical protein